MITALQGQVRVPGPGGLTSAAAVTLVQPTTSNSIASTCSAYSGVTTITCAFPLNLSAGNSIYVAVFIPGGNTVTSPLACSGTATIGSFSTIGSGGNGINWYRATISGSGSCSLSTTMSSAGGMFIFPFEISSDGGADSGTNPVYNQTAYSGATVTLTSITPATINDLILSVFFSQNNPNTYSSLSTYTLVNQGNSTTSSFFTGSYVAPATSAISPTATQSNTAFGNVWDSAISVK